MTKEKRKEIYEWMLDEFNSPDNPYCGFCAAVESKGHEVKEFPELMKQKPSSAWGMNEAYWWKPTYWFGEWKNYHSEPRIKALKRAIALCEE